MKKFLFLFMAVFSIFALHAQITLTHQTHCYNQNQDYQYTMVNYTKAGVSGENCFWDFSLLKENDLLEGMIQTETFDVRKDLFPNSSVAINENGNTFFYQGSEQQMVQVGYIAKGSNSYVKYTKPMVKLKFPFNYMDSYSGEVALSYPNSSYVKKGDYTVTADAFGSITLPNGVSYNHALRVKTLVTYQLNNSSKQVQEIYRWYVQEQPFPVMVVQDLAYYQSSGKIVHTYKAAYNAVTISDLKEVSASVYQISPNPATHQFKVSCQVADEKDLNIDLFDLEGKFVATLFKGKTKAGVQEFTLQLNRAIVQQGMYLVRIQSGDEVFSERLLVQD